VEDVDYDEIKKDMGLNDFLKDMMIYPVSRRWYGRVYRTYVLLILDVELREMKHAANSSFCAKLNCPHHQNIPNF